MSTLQEGYSLNCLPQPNAVVTYHWMFSKTIEDY